jgi:SET domain-containing protein
MGICPAAHCNYTDDSPATLFLNCANGAGHIHNFSSQCKMDHGYLLFLGWNAHFSEDVFIDPRTTLEVVARYINDPLLQGSRNCEFILQPNLLRANIVATRAIQVGEELFISYGDSYWNAQSKPGNALVAK